MPESMYAGTRSGMLRVLLVEDNEQDAIRIERMLRANFECELQRVTTPDEFVGAVRDFDPRIVLADYELAQFTALEALRLLAAENRQRPFILVTGAAAEKAAVDCMRAGADDYILKRNLARLPGAMRNALEKHAALNEKAIAETALRKSEALYRLIMDTSRDLIVLTEKDGQPLYISPSSRTLLGYTPEELLQDKGLCMVHPDDRTSAIEAFRRSALQSDHNSLEVRCKHRNGEWRVFECVGNWVLEDEQPQRAVLVFRDITKRKMVDDERRRAMQALASRERDLRVALTALEKSHHELAAAQQQLIQASRMDAVGQLAAGVAHEVKNPLTVMLLGLEYLRKSTSAPSAEVLDDMEDAVHRANDVVKRLLEFATPAELNREPTDLNEVIGRALRLLEHELARACVSTINDFDHTLQPLLLDRKQIEQVIVGLLMSAVQTMKAGGTIKLRTGRGTTADEVVFEAEDSGSGSGEGDEVRQRIGGPVSATRPGGDKSKLGLRIIEGILGLHGARIELRNRPEGGVHTTIVFRMAG